MLSMGISKALGKEGYGGEGMVASSMATGPRSSTPVRGYLYLGMGAMSGRYTS